MTLPGFARVTPLVPWPHGEHHGLCKPDGSIVLHPDDYGYLRRLSSGWRPTGRVERTMAAVAVELLAHELSHRRGIVDETEATRVGMREFVRIARRLGIGRVLALRMKLLVRGISPGA